MGGRELAPAFVARACSHAPRLAFLLACALSPLPSLAQVPDVRAKLDLALSLDYRNASEGDARLYTPLGRPSVVSLSALLESGYNLFASERLQRLPGNADADIFDEVYAEDPGIWRVGKQYLPFGTGRLLHDSALAARLDSNLIAEGVPVTIAGVNAGRGRPNGAALRIGRNVGVSAAIGEHFGIAATSLGLIRRPDQAGGRGAGWARAFGLDATRRLGNLTLSGEVAFLQGGPQGRLAVTDVEATYLSDGYRAIGLGYTRASGGPNSDFVRVFGRVRAVRNADLEPLVRFRNAGLYDVAVTLRLRF